MPTLEPHARAILITGASSGIGEACALELDRRGFRVFAGVRRQEDGRRLTQASSSRLVPVVLDVTDANSIAAAAETIRTAVGQAGLYGLVNNAGFVLAGPLELLPVDLLRQQLEVNVVGQVAVTQAVLAELRRARGRIVNISSIAGRVAPPFLGPYAASKHALEALSDALRLELRRWGISVSLVEPGTVKTPLWQRSMTRAEELIAQMPSEGHQLYGADIEAVKACSARRAAAAMPVTRVVQAVVHALCARRPKARYPLGFQTRLAIALFKILPVGVRDWLVLREIGLR